MSSTSSQPSSARADAASASALLDSASQTVDLVYQLSLLLNAGLDRSTVALCIGLVECGVNPEALATVVKELRREAEATQQPSSAAPHNGTASGSSGVDGGGGSSSSSGLRR